MSESYGPEERRLLETVAARVYSQAVEQGHLSAEDPGVGDCPDRRKAFDLLTEVGLLALDEAAGHYVPVDPAAIQSRIVVPLGQRGADLLTESARWADAFGALGQTYRRSPRFSDVPITELRGLANINNFIEATVGDCRKELLTAQPYGRRPPADLAAALGRDIQALERGIRMRTLYQHSARQSPATREYVAEVTAHGAEVRTLDEFFNRLIIVDRRVAIVPASASHHVAVAVHQPALVAYLVDVFERAWARAYPFLSRNSSSDSSIASDVRAMTIRMLIEGHSDPTSAKRLGVSTRTYAGYIAALKEEYGVQTRFQLGYAMMREGAERSEAALPAPEH